MRTILATALAAATLLIPTPADAERSHGRPHKACAFEDSVWCVWDARHMGNGKGRSFWSDTNGTIHFVPHRVAHALLEGRPVAR